VGLASPEVSGEVNDSYIGNLSQVKDIISIYKIDEVIFCSKNLSHQTIIDKMAEWHKTAVEYKIAPEDSLSIIGSNSINTRGDLYTINISTINKPANRRNKRFLDLFISLTSLCLYPFLLFIVKKPRHFFTNIIKVLSGKKSWVGYYPDKDNTFHLPKIKPGILTPLTSLKKINLSAEMISNANILYARDYSVWKDLNTILINFREMGRKENDR